MTTTCSKFLSVFNHFTCFTSSGEVWSLFTDAGVVSSGHLLNVCIHLDKIVEDHVHEGSAETG